MRRRVNMILTVLEGIVMVCGIAPLLKGTSTFQVPEWSPMKTYKKGSCDDLLTLFFLDPWQCLLLMLQGYCATLFGSGREPSAWAIPYKGLGMTRYQSHGYLVAVAFSETDIISVDHAVSGRLSTADIEKQWKEHPAEPCGRP